MPTFCRHNRFIERCPICSKTLPGHSTGSRSSRAAGARSRQQPARGEARRGAAAKGASSASAGRAQRARDVRVYLDSRRRGADDGYRCALLPGLRSSEDARRLLEEIAFACGRLKALASAPPGPYAAAAALGREGDVERASWLCFVIAYFSPLEADEPFAGIESVPPLERAAEIDDEAVDALPLGPRTCHEPGRGAATLRAYLAWAKRSGSQRQALTGEESWSAERRFERIFERLAIPGFPRRGRFELLTLLGRLSICELRADSLHFAAATPHAAALRAGVSEAAPPSAAAGGGVTGARRVADASDPVLAAAKRIFGIGDALLLERRARQLAEEVSFPLEALDLALFDWISSQPARLGFPAQLCDEDVLAQGATALGL